MSGFSKPQFIAEAVDDLTKVDYQQRSSKLEDSRVYLGILTRSKLSRLINEGDVSPHAFVFYTTAVSYTLSHLPFGDELNAQFVNIKNS